MVEQIVQCLKLLNEERPQVILIPELENVKDSTVIREGFDLAFPGVRKVKKRIEPSGPADIGVSKLPDLKGTTFGCWDEYADWYA